MRNDQGSRSKISAKKNQASRKSRVNISLVNSFDHLKVCVTERGGERERARYNKPVALDENKTQINAMQTEYLKYHVTTWVSMAL